MGEVEEDYRYFWDWGEEKMTNKELEQVLEKHELWLENKRGGVRANLGDADLRGLDLYNANLRDADLHNADLYNANLSSVNLRGTNLRDANLCNVVLWNAKLRRADLRNADLSGADLRNADLNSADLRNADLRGADIDFASFPLWCGGLDVHLDDRQLAQLAYHLVRNGLFSKNASEETKAELSKIVDFANKFHRVEECGRIEVEK